MDWSIPALLPAAWSTLAGAVLIGLLGLCLAVAFHFAFFTVPYPAGVDLIREPPGKRWFSLRTRKAYYNDCEALFREAYHDYAKKGKAVIIPGILSRSEIILPVQSMKWALSQPEDVLEVNSAFAELDQTGYSLGSHDIVADPWQMTLVRQDINIHLDWIVKEIDDEIAVAFDKRLGLDTTAWREMELHSVMRMVAAQVASRFIVGRPLCRNDDYLETCMEVGDGCVSTAGMAAGAPASIRPIVGFIAGRKTRKLVDKVGRYLRPLYEDRLALVKKYAKDDPGHEEPMDMFQWHLRLAQQERPEELDDFGMINQRVCHSNFGAMEQLSTQATNIFLNILGSDAEHNTVAVLRDEMRRVVPPGLGAARWTRANVAKMTRADSLIRETLRAHSVGGRVMFRTVAAEGGLTTNTGVHLPKGSLISFLSQPAHMDGEVLEDAAAFDPFRFSRIREASADGPSLAMVATSHQYLPFGHGRHACTGRFLVDFEMKMMMTYVLSHYDIKFPDEYGGKRPENKWLTEVLLPPFGAKMMVRRREKGL
ncbi:uncharacterized protein E0L32_010850 [Thyridium curvatum]|uniref:Cytochrome P450 n=1 Tax=Thyridium curvatum TaxID=1093900 RepID=A0A507ALD6_9PEZI|nr:uncharacterized protein E0L32_010850 [Thyridium curvatum]TPX07256.1 hypothetical protein E0L32_010850 [Thyridium curvatum]